MARKADGTFAAEHGADPERVRSVMEVGETYTTGEVANLVDAPRRTVYNYLVELADAGRVTVKKPNARLKLWRRVE